MIDKKTMYFAGIGNVVLQKSKKARRVNISVRLAGEVIVSVPLNCSFEYAERFVISKTERIRKALAETKESEKTVTVFTPDTEFRTKFRVLNMIPESRKNVRLFVGDKSFDIYYPVDGDLKEDSVQKAVRKAVEHVWKIEAHEYIPKRTEYLAELHGFTYTSLKFKNVRSFWGKCFGDNNITFNIHLMHLPDELIDYVILHELCHTIHKNHGKDFWALLDKVTSGKAECLAAGVKKHGTRLY